MSKKAEYKKQTDKLKIEYVLLDDIKLNPKNRNEHTEAQIKQLGETIEYQSFREPVTISNQSGLLVAGECRYWSAKKIGLKEVPDMFQDFESEDQEYAHGIADNAMARWARLDYMGINKDLANLDGQTFDVAWLGLEGFKVCLSEETSDKTDANEEWQGMPEFTQHDAQSFRRIIVHFNSQKEVDDFSKLIGQELTSKTNSIWHPKLKRRDLDSKRYE